MATPTGNPIDPNESTLVNKSFFINNNGSLQQVSRSFIEVISTSFNDFRIGSLEADYANLGNGADTAQGGADDDLLDGGSGDDKLYGDAGNDDLSGGSGMDQLFGGSGNDVLDGGADADTLVGGTGNDLYRMLGQLDTVVEAAGEGIDTIYTNVKFVTLPANVQAKGMGNELDHMLVGGAGIDHLRGLGGNDVMMGGGGQNLLEGGRGDDLYFVASGSDGVLERRAWRLGGKPDRTRLTTALAVALMKRINAAVRAA